jgi:hypothetical protein
MRAILRYILLAVALLTQTPLSAQQEVVVPTEDEILSNTLNTSSPYYYTNLLLKYRSGAESLTAEEYYYLYYGYYFSDEYRPFVENKAFDDLMDVMSGLNPNEPTIGKLELIIERGVASLEVDPFSPKVLNILAYAYGALGDSVREELYFNHLNGILGAIDRSGTGLKEESPKHIIMFSHAYDLLASKGYSYNEARIISRNVEYVPLTRKTEDRIKGFYFDYSRVYRNKPEDVTFKRERTWQFNNLGVKEYK